MEYNKTVVEELTEKVYKIRKEILDDSLRADVMKDTMANIKNAAVENILNDGSFSNEAKRKAELERRLQADDVFTDAEKHLKELVETIRKDDIELNYAENKLRNARLFLKIENGIRE